MGQMGFFNIAKRYAGLNAKNDPLARIDERTEALAWIEEYSAPDERIFVWGWDPALYALSRRIPASRYVTSILVVNDIQTPNDLPPYDESALIESV